MGDQRLERRNCPVMAMGSVKDERVRIVCSDALKNGAVVLATQVLMRTKPCEDYFVSAARELLRQFAALKGAAPER